uniref:Uncharacterized protein n=1 Tax=Clastoptera arizonana TaxID=38151 RepID=A0A1B6DD51_9HEMI
MINILKNFYPSTWDKNQNYSNKTYQLIELSRNSIEFRNVAISFPPNAVVKIWRIQNPYILGAYLLRKNQIEHRQGSISEITKYHTVHQSDLEVALEYNLDSRRYRYNNRRIPQLDESLPFINTNHYCIVCKVLTRNEPFETERLPEYVLEFNSN